MGGHVQAVGQSQVVVGLLCGVEALLVVLELLALPGEVPGDGVRRREARHSTLHRGRAVPVINRPSRGQTDGRTLTELGGKSNIRLTGADWGLRPPGQRNRQVDPSHHRRNCIGPTG